MRRDARIRSFEERDLAAVADFCARVRARDPDIEPFAASLPSLAHSDRALRSLWRVVDGHAGAIGGASFAALREGFTGAVEVGATAGSRSRAGSRSGSHRASVDIYGAVDPGLRRRGLGRQMIEPLLAWANRQGGRVALRALVREASPGQAFLQACGFRAVSAQLTLSLATARPAPAAAAGTHETRRRTSHERFAIRELRRRDAEASPVLRLLAREAYADVPGGFETSDEEFSGMLADGGRVVLSADAGGRPAGYLFAIELPGLFIIEELGVLAELRRRGLGRALLREALRRADGREVVLKVSEANAPALSLYTSLGFERKDRRLVLERVTPSRRRGRRPSNP